MLRDINIDNLHWLDCDWLCRELSNNLVARNIFWQFWVTFSWTLNNLLREINTDNLRRLSFEISVYLLFTFAVQNLIFLLMLSLKMNNVGALFSTYIFWPWKRFFLKTWKMCDIFLAFKRENFVYSRTKSSHFSMCPFRGCSFTYGKKNITSPSIHF